MTTGVLLVNLGSPDAANIRAVKRYLRKFLMDGRVIGLPIAARAILVNALIVPFRAKQSTKAYQAIWTEKGSPLSVYSEALREALAVVLGDHYRVALGMRYGNPSIALALESLKDCEKLIILPLFPQYSSAANGSAIQCAMALVTQYWNLPEVHIVNQFYQHPSFIAAFAKRIAAERPANDFLLMSYHGLPERHIDKSGCKASCDRVGSCPGISLKNAFCYRAQCFETSRLLANALALSSEEYAVSFQSRLGKLPWIKPYTDKLLENLREKGIEHLSVVCPAFVADCLETLEEVGIRLKAQWLSLGGKSFRLIACINTDEAWVLAIKELVMAYA